MSEEAAVRETICTLGRSLFERGLTHGSSGNISARLSDGRIVVSPTGTSFGRLDPARLSVLASNGDHIGGDAPTKEVPLHMAFYETRSMSGAVFHLHSCHSVALSVMPDADPENFLPPLTPYSVMQLGRVPLLPYFLPGDAAIGAAIRGLAGKRSAVMLAHHGPVVAGRDLESACNAIEELEATARLALLVRGQGAALLSPDQIARLSATFNIEYES